MAKVFKHVGLWLAVLFAALCTAGLLVVHAQGEDNALYQTVLGKAVNFGVVAESFSPQNDLQSNFATNKFTPSEHGIHSDLTGVGKYAGDYWITSVVENGKQPFKNYIEQNKKSQFYVGKSTENSPVFLNVDSRNIHSVSDETLRADVSNLYNSALQYGQKLANKELGENVATYTKSTDQNNYGNINTTSYADNATIYLNGDDYINELQATGKIHINKLKDQNIVFNFTKTASSSITIGQFNIQVGDDSFDTTTDSSISDKNVKLSEQARHIFFNIRPNPELKTVKIDMASGVFLVDGADVVIERTSAGWIVTNGNAKNTDGEWHNIYPGTENTTPDTPTTSTKEKGSLTFTKTFDGYNVTEADLNNISFTVTGPDNYSKTFTLGDIKQNDGTYSKTLTGLAIGEYTVTENKADKVEGYTLVTKDNVTGDKTEVSKTSDKANVTAGGAATIALKNIYSQNKGKLTFTKTFDGYNVTDQDKNNITFTVKDKTGKMITTVKLGDMTKGSDGKYTYTVENLTPGDYTVTENNADSIKGYSLVTKENVKDNGKYSVTSDSKTVKSDKTSTIDLSDVYTQKKGELTFTKTFGGDNVTAEDLKNISFEVKGPNNYDQVFFLKDIKKDDGTYSKTLTDLEWGKYTVTENYADDVNGYKLEETSIVKGSTEISGSQLIGTANLSDIYTQKKGELTFTKTFGGGVTEEDLDKISFEVTGPNGYNQTYSLADIKNSDGTYSKTLNNLEWGTYTVKEINADKVNGYTLDKTSQIEGDVTVDATHLEGDANTINLTDNYSPVHPRVQLFKNEFYNGDLTGNPVGGASYALYRWKGSKASLQLFTMLTRASVDPATETDWSKVTRSDIMNSDNWEYLGEDNTDGTGFVCSKDELNEGDIVAALEVTAPAGYQRTANPAILQVHVNKAATLISDSDGAFSLDKDGNLQWKETVVRIGIKKVDANGNAVVGAKMAVLDKDGKVIDTWTTTKDNLVHETDKLTAGETYTLRELQAPEGYEKAADVTFTAEAKDIKGTDEYVQSVTMIDQKSQPAKPGTPSKGTSVKPAQTVAQGVKTGDPTTIGGLVLMFAAAGAVLVLSAKHLKAMR